MSRDHSPWWQHPAQSSSLVCSLLEDTSPRNCLLPFLPLGGIHSLLRTQPVPSLGASWRKGAERLDLTMKCVGKGIMTKRPQLQETWHPGDCERQYQATEKDRVGLKGQAWSHVDFILGSRESLACLPLPGKDSRSCLKLAALELDTTPTPQLSCLADGPA